MGGDLDGERVIATIISASADTFVRELEGGTMRNAMLLVGVLVAATGCDELTSRLKGDSKPAPATTAATASAGDGLPPECETFLARFACLLQKQGKPTTEADEMRAAWIGPASQPALRPGILNVCTTQLSVQAQNFKSAGCDGATAATAPVVKAAADAGKPATATATATTATTSATAAPNVDAKGRPCKATEIAVKGVCQDACRSDQQCKEGLVCSGVIPGRPEKFCSDMICRAPERRLRENHFQVKCAIPCNSNADCTNGKKCGETLYGNEEANNAITHACE